MQHERTTWHITSCPLGMKGVFAFAAAVAAAAAAAVGAAAAATTSTATVAAATVLPILLQSLLM